jgi:hypothetical protein
MSNPAASLESSMEPRWIEAEQSPFGVRIFDCRAIATALTATSTDADAAEQFMALRESDGAHLFGKRPANPVRVDVSMSYPLDIKDLPDRGIVFRAGSMEEKWDIAIDDGVLTFARSWTGEVVYNCDIKRESDAYMVSTLVLPDDLIVDDDVSYHVHVVNFLLWSHVFDIVYPHPLAGGADTDEDTILMSSFSAFGKRGWFATTERFSDE